MKLNNLTPCNLKDIKKAIETPHQKSGVSLMPIGIKIYNGNNEPCDVLLGPCSCGAWHSKEDWKEYLSC